MKSEMIFKFFSVIVTNWHYFADSYQLKSMTMTHHGDRYPGEVVRVGEAWTERCKQALELAQLVLNFCSSSFSLGLLKELCNFSDP